MESISNEQAAINIQSQAQAAQDQAGEQSSSPEASSPETVTGTSETVTGEAQSETNSQENVTGQASTAEQNAAEETKDADGPIAPLGDGVTELTEEQKAAAELLEDKKQRAGENHFVHEGKVYVPVLPKVSVPNFGVRTAVELCVDKGAQAYMVKIGSPLIKEIE